LSCRLCPTVSPLPALLSARRPAAVLVELDKKQRDLIAWRLDPANLSGSPGPLTEISTFVPQRMVLDLRDFKRLEEVTVKVRLVLRWQVDAACCATHFVLCLSLCPF